MLEWYKVRENGKCLKFLNPATHYAYNVNISSSLTYTHTYIYTPFKSLTYVCVYIYIYIQSRKYTMQLTFRITNFTGNVHYKWMVFFFLFHALPRFCYKMLNGSVLPSFLSLSIFSLSFLRKVRVQLPIRRWRTLVSCDMTREEKNQSNIMENIVHLYNETDVTHRSVHRDFSGN